MTSEAERIKTVYEYYDHTPKEQAKRDLANAGNRAIQAERLNAISQILQRESVDLATARILDIGCGAGGFIGWLIDRGARPEHCWGIDLLEQRIALARARHPGANFAVRDARELDFPDNSLDLVICSTLFSSVLDAHVAGAIAKEIDRVLAPDGMILWYDNRFPNPSNPNVREYGRRDISALFPGYASHLRPITVLPAIARRLGRFTDSLYPWLARCRPICIRYIGSIRREGGRAWS